MSVISASFRPTPYWWDEAPPVEGVAEAPQASYDVVVVGSGVTGLNAALTLAEGGRSVAVVDAGLIGSGASSRNNGSIVPFGFRHQDELERVFGAEVGAAVAKVAVDAFDYTRSLPERYGFDAMIKPYERFILASTPKHYEHLEHDAQLQAQRGVGLDWTPMSKDELEQRTEIRGFHGAVHGRNSLAMHPGLFTQGLVRAAVAAGVTTVSNCRVTAVRNLGAGILVHTQRGDIRARNVIVGTDGYSDGAFPFLEHRIVPARLHMGTTEPLPAEVMQRLFPDRQLQAGLRSLHWIRPSPDGTRAICGGRGGMMGNDPQVHARKLHEDFVRLAPELADTKLDFCWWGLIGFPMDFTPHTGEVDGIHYAAGYSGVGYCTGSYLGNRVANRVLGKPASEWQTALDRLRFRRIPGPSLLRPAYSRGGVAWYQLRDWWDLHKR